MKISKKKSIWAWALGVVATAFAGAAMVIFRGCWHRKMSWPVRSRDVCYQVCLGCGIKRLFDDDAFRPYGPYSYDLNELIAASRPSEIPASGGPSWKRSAS
ncbi:MAG: hypothetical protein JOY93_08305 [Acidobacteriales bacterium]|nr:hypothetical protein [Terriglobales bacterium]